VSDEWHWWCWKCNHTVPFSEAEAIKDGCPSCGASKAAFSPHKMKEGDVTIYGEEDDTRDGVDDVG
jgi:predicted  nucleic acid-binding Zn-ribbon protein